MLTSLRTRLTLWFVFLSLVLYAAGGFSAVLVFSSALTTSLDEELRGLLFEILPAIEYKNDLPTLKHWADTASAEHLTLPATIQLYNASGKLLERYGPLGVPKLTTGNAREESTQSQNVIRSINHHLAASGKPVGYLQVQLSTKHRDHAVHQISLTLLFLAPFVATAIGIFGFVFSSIAVKPTAETLQLLRRFVADAGHELNTPITIIEASLQTLEETLKENNISNEVLASISRASARMKDLASNLILLARLENPALASPQKPINLKDVVNSVVEELKSTIASHEITLVLRPLPQLTIFGHEESLKRMLSNLLNNAVRYTEPGGTITVAVEAQSNEAIISVEDTGIGIPKESIEHIFERFYRVDKSRSRAQGGSGLGLSIVKAIVEAHKGKVTVVSELGKGSKFTVFLPAN